MKKEIKQRIDDIRNGKLPNGYSFQHGYIFPKSWKFKRFKELFVPIFRKNIEGNTNVLTISAQMGLVNQQLFFDKEIASSDKSNYYFLEFGDFAYNKSYSSGYPFGAIKRLNQYNSGIVSPLYICFSIIDKQSSDFYELYFDGGVLNKEIYQIADEGARNHGLLNIHTDDFYNTNILYPPLPEQQAIAEVLSTCDRVLSLKRELLSELQKRKKWLMQKLLDPNSGVRLPGFKGKWEKKSVNQICEISGGGTPSKSNNSYWEGNIPWVSSSDVTSDKIDGLNINRFITEEALNNSATKLCRPNTILVVSRVGVGKVNIAPMALCTSQDFTNLYFPNGNYRFMAYQLLAIMKIKLNEVQGTSIKGITCNEIGAISLYIPSLPEQTAIANVLSTADREIELVEEEIQSWELKKKSLMQLLLTGIVRTV